MPTRKKRATKKKVDDAREKGRTVLFVVNRPYSAGESYDVVTAEVTKEHEDDPDILDLTYTDPHSEEEAAAKHAPRSDRQEPGTWHEGGE